MQKDALFVNQPAVRDSLFDFIKPEPTKLCRKKEIVNKFLYIYVLKVFVQKPQIDYFLSSEDTKYEAKMFNNNYFSICRQTHFLNSYVWL